MVLIKAEKEAKMENRKIVVVLLVIAIILSGINIVVSMGFDFGDFGKTGCADRVDCVDVPDSTGGEVSLTITTPEGNET
ncbi:MAG: hypothetical protein KJ718_06075 [Nanoarchaeota archaeon]|nr:hypothetical protein [Nanoarchaeota archaeon]MBU1052089.1 hypothetical protein [Nanoarchaeota archaeon]MBU1988479.1 hypothetical protein [Nanoarchaeota archaeon]